MARIGYHQVVQVNTKAKANFTPHSARAAYWAFMQTQQGKTVAQVIKAATANPPSLPKSGRAEPPSGWVSYFARNGYITLAEPKS